MTREPDSEHGPGRPPGNSVEELRPEMRGRWLVTTQGSRHVWDLDTMTYRRMPGATSRAGAMPHDQVMLQINRVVSWPRVGECSFIWCDDPDNPLMEHWRRSSTITSIDRLPEEPGDFGPSNHSPNTTHHGATSGAGSGPGSNQLNKLSRSAGPSP